MQETKEAPITDREERVQPQQRLCVIEKVKKIVLFSCKKHWNSHCEICAEPHINTAAFAHIIWSACITVLPLDSYQKKRRGDLAANGA